MISQDIVRHVQQYESPHRVALSRRYPRLRPLVMLLRRSYTFMRYYLPYTPRLKRAAPLGTVIARHSSLLYRRLGSTDPVLQRNKVHNLALAIKRLNGIVIPPGGTFSLWRQLGPTTARAGYVEGLVLSNGLPGRATGGGLCQLSNLLFWLFLHADTAILERHHHSVDAFPDSGRTLPFASGATIFYNYLDLKIKNTSAEPLQIALWLTEEKLMGQLRSDRPASRTFHIREEDHCFIAHKGLLFRYNRLYRDERKQGARGETSHLCTNFAPVVYRVDIETLRAQGMRVIELTANL